MQRKPFQQPARTLGLIVFAGLLAIFSALPSAAQDLHTYSVNVFAGLGGAFDAEPSSSLDNDSFQLGFSLSNGPRNLIGARVGQVNMSGSQGFGIFSNADLTYVTIGGEFRSRRNYYDSGLYIALGGYQLTGTTFDGSDGDETAVGLAVGTTADFPINRWISVLAELSGHVTDLDQAQFFGMLHLGVSFRF